jgi:hypothetical protein
MVHKPLAPLNPLCRAKGLKFKSNLVQIPLDAPSYPRYIKEELESIYCRFN